MRRMGIIAHLYVKRINTLHLSSLIGEGIDTELLLRARCRAVMAILNDKIIESVDRKAKITDNPILWDATEKLAEHCWKNSDYLVLVGAHGIVLNGEKLQFYSNHYLFLPYSCLQYVWHQLRMSTLQSHNMALEQILFMGGATSILDF